MMSSKNIFLFLLMSIIFHLSVLSQRCAMHEVPYIATGLNDSVGMKMVYDSISNDMSGNSTFLLINSYGQVRKRKAYVISVDSIGSIICGYEMIEDISGIVYKKTVINRHYKLPPSDTLRRVLLVGSSSIAEAHMNSILLISNRKKGVRLEYQDLDGDGHSCIRKSTAPSLMKYAVEILEDIFKKSLRSSVN